MAQASVQKSGDLGSRADGSSVRMIESLDIEYNCCLFIVFNYLGVSFTCAFNAKKLTWKWVPAENRISA